MTKISFVIPCFNTVSKVSRCLDSLDALKLEVEEIEAIFIDDASTDATVEKLEEWITSRPWAKLIQLNANSGSPSKPRNVGIENALGKYIYFLDPDDEIIVRGICSQLQLAESVDADVLRSPLIRDDGRRELILNKVSNWEPSDPKRVKVEKLFAQQSTTVCGLVKRSLLNENKIKWNEDLRLGEDSVFWSEVYVAADVIEYIDEIDFVYHVEAVQGQSSSTQQYENRELRNHLTAWSRVSENLSRLGVDYFQIRGQVALQTALQSLIKFNQEGIGREEFDNLNSFLLEKRTTVEAFNFNSRLSEILSLAVAGEFIEFNDAIKPRLLIAGYDLKFIRSALPALQDYFQVQIDEWTGHDSHDVEKSERLLAWAEVIHCEWLLGNAVWYSCRKKAHQKLVVRTHLFEVNRDFGDHVDIEKIDKFIAVSTPTQEDIQRRFGFPRERLKVLPNYIETSAYLKSSDPDKVFNLAIVGILPSRKGFHRALEVLHQLRQLDDRYNLSVYGKLPSELAWVANDSEERKYFEKCDRFIQEKSLESAIHYPGWSDMKEALADKAFLFSVSDFESFHVAPAEAFAAGNIAYFLPWRGVEYIYPARYIKNSVAEIRDAIFQHRNLESFNEESAEGEKFVRETYGLDRFIIEYSRMISTI